MDIKGIFPRHTTVVRLQGLILGTPANTNDTCLQAVLFSFPIRDDTKVSFFLLREYDNATFRQLHIEDRKLENVEDGETIRKKLSSDSAFTLIFEVPNEMKNNPSALSQAMCSSAFGTNYVINCDVPKEVFGGGKKFEGLRKMKREFINGFLFSGPSFWSQSLLLDNINWQRQLRLLNYSEYVYTFIFVPKKASADMLLILETQLVMRLPSDCFCIFLAWGSRFSTSFKGERNERRTNRYSRPQLLEELNFAEFLRQDSTEELPVLRKISPKEEILVIQIDYGIFKPFTFS